MFNISQIIQATSGELLKGPSDLRVIGISTDSRGIKRNELFIPLKGKNFDGHDFIFTALKAGATALLLERGFFENKKNLLNKLPKNVSCILVSDTLKALGDLALFNRKRFAIPIIAITGSSGKTTTKEMVASILESRYKVLKNKGTQNNLIGVPLTLLTLKEAHQIACIELGTNTPGEIIRLSEIARPTFAIITNIAQAHLEKLKTLAGVFSEKIQLVKGLIHPAVTLINQDDIYLNRISSKYDNVFGFGREKVCDFLARSASFDSNGFLRFKIKGSKQIFAIKTFGVHNIYNALAAIAVGIMFAIPPKSIANILRNFKFPKGRFNIIRKNDFTIIDDSYNANPLSFENAIKSMQQIKTRGKKILVIADMLELGAKARLLHAKLGGLLKEKDFDFILSYGDLASLALTSSVRKGFDKKKVFTFKDIPSLKNRLSLLLERGDLILVKGSRAMQMEQITDFLLKTKLKS